MKTDLCPRVTSLPLVAVVEQAFARPREPDVRAAVVLTDGSVSLRAVESGDQVLRLPAATSPPEDATFHPRVAFSPDGRYLAVSDWSGGVVLRSAGGTSRPDARKAAQVPGANSLCITSRARLARYWRYSASLKRSAGSGLATSGKPPPVGCTGRTARRRQVSCQRGS